MTPRLHPREEERLRELRRYNILDTERERDFDDLVEIASEICEVPVSVVNFIDEGRQWFKAEVGLGVRSTPIETSLCGHVILEGDFVEIPDTLEKGLPLGTLCVLDHKPRTLTPHQRRVLEVLSKHVMRELELRLALAQEQTLRREVDHRVKNSLASIGALLSMKAQRATDEAVQTALEDASIRIRSLSSLHAELHDLAQGERVELRSLFERIERDLRQLLPDGIRLVIEVGDDRVSPSLANALLLIVNEFVSNSVKHGLQDRSGSIAIAIRAGDDGWSIACSDDGSATSADAERAALAKGLGTRVIQSLASSFGVTPDWSANGSGMHLRIDAAA